MSIILDKASTLDLCLEDEDTYKIWITGLQLFINECYVAADTLVKAKMQYYKNEWATVDTNMDKKLDLSEIKLLLRRLNIEVNDDYLKEIFDKHDDDKNGTIEFEEFIKMMDSMRMRMELQPIFN